MEAGKWFIEDALVAPWSTQKDIGEIEKSGNQIITLSKFTTTYLLKVTVYHGTPFTVVIGAALI